MRISVLGLGYVGCITAACLAREGHVVTGVDVNEAKVRALQEGLSPLLEPELDALVEAVTALHRLQATLDVEHAVMATDLSLICVGTPSNANGGVDARYVLRVCQQIGAALKHKPGYHVVALRSTVLPEILRECLAVLTVTSGKTLGDELGFVANPEFLREGTAIRDFYHPPLTVIGQHDGRAGDRVAQLYAGLPGPLVRTDPATAMLVKYASNAFHALKISFANEVGRLCGALDVDAQAVMDIVCRDTTLNISPRYLKPGFAFGGSCLPKDVRALMHQARHLDQSLPVIEAILPSNQLQIQAAIEAVANSGRRQVGVIGLAFKPGTDDLRESPMVQLAETLLGKGYHLKIYDASVQPANLIGSNLAYIERALPHLASVLCPSLDEVIAGSEVLIVAHSQPAAIRAQLVRHAADRLVIDLAHNLLTTANPSPIGVPTGALAEMSV